MHFESYIHNYSRGTDRAAYTPDTHVLMPNLDWYIVKNGLLHILAVNYMLC